MSINEHKCTHDAQKITKSTEDDGKNEGRIKARLCYDILTKNLIVAEVQKLTGDITKFKWIPTKDMVDTLIK